VRLNPDKGEYYDVLLESLVLLLSGMSFNAEYQRVTHILSTGAITLFYEIGYELGKDIATELRARSKNPADIFSTGINHYFIMGMGKIEISIAQLLKMATLKQMTVKIKNNFPAIALDQTGRAECHITRGYLVGGAEVLSGKQWVCEELMCLCKNDPYCEFKLKRAPVQKRQT
jgi:predicted hydrocarbon binding protein